MGPPGQAISAQELRDLFNVTLRCLERLQQGELWERVLKDKHPSNPPAREPHCTRSQIVQYYDRQGDLIALVHQYLRTDGSIGASGKPDPKRVLHQGVWYYVRAE